MSEKSAPFSAFPPGFGRRLTLALTAGVVATLGACTTTSTTTEGAGGDQTPRSDWTINHDAWAELGYQWQWTGYPPTQPNADIVHANAYEDLLTFVGSGSTVSALETNTGKVRWSRQLDRATTRFVEPVRRGDTLYVASDTELWELDLRNGNTIDRDSLGTLVNTPPLLMGNKAIFGTLAGELFAWQMENDFKLWSYQFDGPIDQPAIRANDRYLAAMSRAGDLRTLEAANAHSGMNARIAGGTDVDLVTDNVGIYVASLDQSIYAFDIEDGFRFWRLRSSAPITVQPTLHEGVLYATTRDQGLAAIDSATGDVIWNNDEIGGWVVTIADDSELIVWTGYEIIAVDKDRGDVIARARVDGVSGIRTDSIADGDIYVITRANSVAKFSPR